MCNIDSEDVSLRNNLKTIPVYDAVGMVLAHDITEIRHNEFKGRAFKKGHIIRQEDIPKLLRIGKENIYVLEICEDELHEDDAAYILANALIGKGVKIESEPKEGRINIVADTDGLLKVKRSILFQFNLLGEVMCSTLHSNTIVKKGEIVSATRVIPLLIKKEIIERALKIINGLSVIEVKELRRPNVGIVITGNEIYYGRIKDAFAPIISKKIENVKGNIIGIQYAPDDEAMIEARLLDLLDAGADLLIITGGMSVDPDDVTRFAISKLGATNITYGSAVLPGAMFLVAYLDRSQNSNINQKSLSFNLSPSPNFIPILGIPACGMYHKITVFDLILPRILAGEIIGRKELAELGHGGLCQNCKVCSFPTCPFGK